MNIISVEHLPPLNLISNNQLTKNSTDRNHTLQFHPNYQDRIVPPPLTIVSKGKAVIGTGVPPPLTIISKGKTVVGTGIGTKAVPTTIVSKGKAINDNGTRGAGSLPVRKGKEIRPNVNETPTSGKSSLVKANVVLPIRVSNAKVPLAVKKYDAVSVPMPFFGRFKSRIPLKAPTPPHQELGDQSTATNENELGAHQAMINSDSAVNDMELVGAGHTMVDGLTDAAVETSDKAVQTECFCNCGGWGSSNVAVLEAITKISAELRDLKSNITGKAVVGKIAELFPIKSDAELHKIDYNIENTESFELRLKLYLKYLKPKSSVVISTAFKELVDDAFLVGKNWDGVNKAKPLNRYRFFDTILFDAWKNTMFTKDVYVSAMKAEIKKSHDRGRKRGKPTEEGSSVVPDGLHFV